MKKLKSKQIYLIIGILLIGIFAYTGFVGKGYWEGKVEKNTETRSGRSRGGVHGFYHK